ncbi:hypothetical protein CDD80_5488 [Ophiocordyceps camponoti-rufipedis]|uniref:Uncharacterized protein n=1 Tax=Ophiocordyceps camponoti-rufipedis TaxID=2004952 RepID=A0A2C5YVT7_9HYPO|nr:hypothetical protein CDD80_5488 [Ophiocordyceps camponoti-rufipedis]
MDPVPGADSSPTAATIRVLMSESELIDDCLYTIHDSRAVNQTRLRSESSSFTPYHRPIRSETPRSSHSTVAPSLEDLASPPAASMAQSADPPETGVIAIGMALGSPSQLPTSSTAVWPYANGSCVPTVTTTVEAQIPKRSDSTKSKSRKWGIFRSRSKRDKSHDEDRKNQSSSAPSSASHQVRATSTVDRAAHDSPKRTPKTLVKPRAESTPASERSKSPLAFLTTAASRDGQKENRRRRDTVEIFQSPSPPSPASDKLLDVDIPDVTMERYSVMFSHLLENRSTNSLLARRQATRDRIKALREGEGQPPSEPSQASSSFPNIMISGSCIPPLRLGPTEGSDGLKPSYRQRSNTLPVILSSPVQTDFEAADPSQNQSQEEMPRHVAASVRRGDSKKSKAHKDEGRGRPILISKYHQRSMSEQSMTIAPTSPPSSVSKRVSRPPSGHEWKSAHPPLSDSSTPSAFSPPGVRSVSSPSEVSPPAANGSSKDPVEMSIARQISVSRQQRAMLGTLQRQVFESKRLNETKSATPHLVDPVRNPESPVFRQGESAVVEGY